MIPNSETYETDLVQSHLQSKSTLQNVANDFKGHQGTTAYQVNEVRDITSNSTYGLYARDIIVNSTYITSSHSPYNFPSTSEQRPIFFQYRLPVEDFTGRQKELSFLKEKLCIANPRVMVVSGLGGTGKTQLIKQFIKENKDYYRNVVWINSQGRESIEREFKTLAESELGISLNVNGKERDFRIIIHMIFDRLSTSKTLLVFDNVDKVDTVQIVLDIVAVDVKPHILITSRIQEFSESVNFIKLEVFGSEVALEYISKKLDHLTLDDRMVLADTLKNLPLALRQATAHIKYHQKQNGNYKICNYIADFKKYREQMLSSHLFQNDIFHHYKETTLTTWQITMNSIRECEPDGELALRILHIMAYFDSAQIMREIFFNLKGLSDEPELNERQVRSAVRLIINYSMVDDYENQSVLSIHKLVQEVIRIQLANEQRSKPTLRDGLRLISQMEENEKFKLCLEHGISVYLSALRFRELVIDFDTFPSMILQNLRKAGNYLRAFSFGTDIIDQFTAILNKDHQSSILLQHGIADSYRNLGKYSEALQMYEEVFEKAKSVLGENHPNTIRTKHNIAFLYNNLGEHLEAQRMYDEVLKKQKIVLGKDHRDTILTKHNIALLYDNLGKHLEAQRMYDKVLEMQKIVLGEHHRDTIRTKHNIAHSYSRLGKHSEALQMYEEVLEKQINFLGKDHPDALRTKYNIALSYDNLGKHLEAFQLYEEVLNKQEMALGKDHPDAIRTKCNIAVSKRTLGKRRSEAALMYEEVYIPLK